MLLSGFMVVESKGGAADSTVNTQHGPKHKSIPYEWVVVLFAAIIYLAGVFSPPYLMDDVDAAQALQAKNMLVTGDWVSMRLNGVLYLEKAPLKYWLNAILYDIFGIHDWVARLVTALSSILLCLLVVRVGRWAGAPKAGFYGGLAMATSIGLFLFTRTIIPDVLLTLIIAFALWSFLRAIEEPARSLRWALSLYASTAVALLTKGLEGPAFIGGIAFLYLLFTRQLFVRETWKRLYVIPGVALFLLISLPWHVLAILRNPPYFDIALHPGPSFGGKYRGFFWFYFINEQVLRFLDERWPRDYNTVPRFWFWVYNLFWFYPWSFFLPSAFRLSYKPTDRTSRLRLLCLCWIGVVMVFFTFSTTQEYYSMPIYPALALLLGFAMTVKSKWNTVALRITGTISAVACAVIAWILIAVRNMPTPGDIADALSRHPKLYSLSLGHMADLTLPALAYLRLPLAVAGLALLAGALGCWLFRAQRGYLSIGIMLLLFLEAARIAMISFDPYLSSQPIAETLKHSPRGTLITYGDYNTLSSVFFYTGQNALILDGRFFILEYGSYAPDAPKVFIDDQQGKQLWAENKRFYLLTKEPGVAHIEEVFGKGALHLVQRSGDKYLYTNEPL